VTVDGLISGLKTSSIIEQLMRIERAPQQSLQVRQGRVRAAADAYSSIRSRLTSVAAAAAALSTAARWEQRTATSSNTAVASVRASGTAVTGSLSFTVEELASAHGVRTNALIESTGSVVASSGTVNITSGDGVTELDVGSGTMLEVVAAVNGSNLGIRATAINTGAGFRLQLTSSATGSGAAFDLEGFDPWVGGTVVTTEGRDARLVIGTGPGAYTITSKNNSFTDLMVGMTVTVGNVSAEPVTVTVTEDVGALSRRVQELVDTANAALAEIATRTAYNPGTSTGASLAGDPTVRRLAQDVTRAVTEAAGGAQVGGVGVRLERTGRFSFDPTLFSESYAADPVGVRNLFAQSATTTPGLEFVGAGPRASAGTYEVVVTRAAREALAIGPAQALPSGTAITVGIRVAGAEASVDLDGTEDAAAAAAALRAAIDAAGLALSVDTDGDSLVLATTGVGSGSRFEVSWGGSTWETHEGVDIAGTIGGAAATGVGRQLSIAAATPLLGGLSVRVSGSSTGAVGSVSYSAGAAQRLASAVGRALDPADGYLTAAETGRRRRAEDLQKSIDSFEVRLAAREARLRTYYSNLESSLGHLQQKSSWLAGQIAGMYANRP
jgi:flagellar hook-associated protein 2